MNKKTTPDIETRIRQLAAEISAIAEFAEGSIKKTASTYATKDGTRKRSKPQYKFQTRGKRGEQRCKHIPNDQLPRVKKLLENGRRYRRLEAEYSRLVTEASLDAPKKTAEDS